MAAGGSGGYFGARLQQGRARTWFSSLAGSILKALQAKVFRSESGWATAI